MSATLYDEVLLRKINSWTEKTKLQVFGPAEARNRLEVLADLNDDQTIKLPFIVLSRPDGYVINNHNKRPISYNGKKFYTSEEAETVIETNGIPITLTYNLDVYTRYEQEADAYMRELIFNFINYPNVKVILPYLDTGLVHTSTVRFSSDNVQVNRGSLALKSDQIFNYGIELKIDDAYLWDVRQRGFVQLVLDESTITYDDENSTLRGDSTKEGIIIKEHLSTGSWWYEEDNEKS